MRRIYDSSALHRDDAETHAPRERNREARPQAMRSVPSGFLSKLFVPYWLRYRAVSVDVSTPDRTFEQGQRVPFTIRMRNELPIPITLPIESPLPWTWAVDGHPEASHVQRTTVPDERRGYHFDRGEAKEFTRHWSGSFRIARREWEPAAAGEHAISVAVNVANPADVGLEATTTIRIDED
ncbi:hypothetical protein L593_12095 [Salinarchaeum sp. Harcht-Bsk1]|uniref:hypothetical protein n=1 Tax=Salinarchaeum sp. Harcht-Bsk1 TaxID=1333523 RepID=UPI0003422E91|nr:hypothetical protein [Salinarchaeum sp. Harcht-Bsk1]AGN02362.1 hypothetical protein L593_12095 [Salinarchaeum sp. Harcht-Bsk1]